MQTKRIGKRRCGGNVLFSRGSNFSCEERPDRQNEDFYLAARICEQCNLMGAEQRLAPRPVIFLGTEISISH